MKVSITVDRSSVNQVAGNLKGKLAETRQGAHTLVEDMAETIFREMDALTPIKTGALQRSGKITMQDDRDHPTAIFSYGDSSLGPRGVPTSQYAVEVHETPSKRNPQSYKWVEVTLLSMDQRYLQELLRWTSSILGK
jgi:hypothetical protein